MPHFMSRVENLCRPCKTICLSIYLISRKTQIINQPWNQDEAGIKDKVEWVQRLYKMPRAAATKIFWVRAKVWVKSQHNTGPESKQNHQNVNNELNINHNLVTMQPRTRQPSIDKIPSKVACSQSAVPSHGGG